MPSKRVRKGKTVWIGAINRKNFRKECLFQTKTKAHQWEEAVKRLFQSEIPLEDIARLLDEGAAPEAIPQILEKEKTPTVSLMAWAEAYLDYARQEYTRKVYSEKRAAFKSLIEALGPNFPADAIDPSRAYDHLMNQRSVRSANSVNKDRKNLTAAWNWGMKFKGLPEPNPFQVVDKFKHDRGTHYKPPLEDFSKVLKVAQDQEKTMLLTFYYTAARRGEIYRLKWSDVDFKNGLIRLTTRKRKGGVMEEDWLPMHEELARTLELHKELGLSDEWVFVQTNRRKGQPFIENRGFPQNLCEKAGVKPFGLHGIRGLAGTVLAESGEAMVNIASVLRHKNVRTTERYINKSRRLKPTLEILKGGLEMVDADPTENRPTSILRLAGGSK